MWTYWVRVSGVVYIFCVDSIVRSGKSSLIMALFRAVEPSLMSGEVLIDGVDTKKMPLRELRNSMRYVAVLTIL
jgi:ABC-type multidrug transport system fused ATPase/permease subunit